MGVIRVHRLARRTPKEDVAAAATSWAGALGEGDPDKVLPLYSDDAVLWGTLSPTVRADRAALRDYLVTAFKVLPGLKGKYPPAKPGALGLEPLKAARWGR